jgi:acyl dehydratase
VRGHNEHPGIAPFPGVGSLPEFNKSASRIDLVKYAAATGDYNPIHFDHQAARNAGLEGIVVHGLLMAAWAMQVASSVSPRPDPLAHLKIRFRNPLRPGESAHVSGRVGDVAPDDRDCQISLEVARGDEKLVTAAGVLRLDG